MLIPCIAPQIIYGSGNHKAEKLLDSGAKQLVQAGDGA